MEEPEPINPHSDSHRSSSSAKPVPASTLLRTRINQHQRQYVRHPGQAQIPKRIKTGHQELDEYVLLGGVDRGVVVGLSGDSGEGAGRLVSKRFPNCS